MGVVPLGEVCVGWACHHTGLLDELLQVTLSQVLVTVLYQLTPVLKKCRAPEVSHGSKDQCPPRCMLDRSAYQPTQ